MCDYYNTNLISTCFSDPAVGYQPELSLQAEVVLGVLSKDCRGLGICKIVPTNTLTRKCSVTTARLEKLSDERLRFSFDAGSICKVLLCRQFLRGKFTMEEDFTLPEFVLTGLELERNVISRGDYPVLNRWGHYHVYFQLITT